MSTSLLGTFVLVISIDVTNIWKDQLRAWKIYLKPCCLITSLLCPRQGRSMEEKHGRENYLSTVAKRHIRILGRDQRQDIIQRHVSRPYFLFSTTSQQPIILWLYQTISSLNSPNLITSHIIQWQAFMAFLRFQP